MNRFLIAGLGNPGPEYAHTRHNAGFLIAEKLALEAGEKFHRERLAEVARIKHRGRQLVLIKPSTFMNVSGKAVSYWLQHEDIPVSNLLVLVDEIALPFGKIRIGPKGSDGGHNGLSSIQETLGTIGYPRLRFGIGSNFGKGQQVDYVLGEWDNVEKETLASRLSLAAEAVKAFAYAGLEHSMNEFNSR
jgi:peptidyl-tRNA hydrolase, PTH1 family